MSCTLRRWISVGTLVALVVGLCVATPVPAGAAPGPWSWVRATGATASGTGTATATCPTGYLAVIGGSQWDSTVHRVQVSGRTYSVHGNQPGSHSPVQVTAWCAKSGQVDVQLVDRTLSTNRASGDYGTGAGDFTCDGDRTPLTASLTWRSGDSTYFSYITQSGPETVNGTNAWFVAAHGLTTAAVLNVKLFCVANADLPGATWVTGSATAGKAAAQKTVSATCPAQQRLVTGGEHVDSSSGVVTSSRPVDWRTWTATASVPPRDTLSVAVLCVPAGDPVATITAGPGHVINTSTARFTFGAVDPATGTVAHNYCFLDTSGLGPCTDIYDVSGLTDGQHVFSIEAYTDDGRGWAPTEKDYYFWVDLTRPTVALATPAPFTLTTTATVRATGADNQALDHYDYTVLARQAAGAGASTVAAVTTSYTNTTGTLTFAVRAGWSYRVSATAVDWAGNISTAATASTAAPLDNLDLTASSQWSLVKSDVYTNKIVSRTTAAGATLTEPVFGKTLGVVATTCPTCGRLGVYSGSTLLGTIDLHAAATHYQQITTVSLGSAPVQATVALKVLSTGALVEVDGLGAVVT